MTYEQFCELFKPLNDAIKDGRLVFDIDPDLYNYIMSDEYLNDNGIQTTQIIEADLLEILEKEKT